MTKFRQTIGVKQAVDSDDSGSSRDEVMGELQKQVRGSTCNLLG